MSLKVKIVAGWRVHTVKNVLEYDFRKSLERGRAMTPLEVMQALL